VDLLGVRSLHASRAMSEELQPLSPEEGVDRFLAQREPVVRRSTYENAVTRLNHFLRWCEEEEDVTNLNDLNGRDLASFVAWRQPDLAPITLQKQLSTVRTALRWWADIEAVHDGLAEKLHSPELPDGAESRDEHLKPERARHILNHLGTYHPGSRRHALMALLWRTGMRRSALRSIDVDDLHPDEHAVELKHRLGSGSRLKNGDDGERWVYLGPQWFRAVKQYRDNPERPDVTDDHGRRPLFSTEYGRATGDTIYTWVNRATLPCEYGDCPHGRDRDECPALGTDGYPSKCPSARSPHDVRRGSITHHLHSGTPPETVSERMDVSLDVLYRHYDARTEREKMSVRRDQLPDS